MRTDFENELLRHGLPTPSRTVDTTIVGRSRRPAIVGRRIWIPTTAAIAMVVAIMIVWPNLPRRDAPAPTTEAPLDRLDAIVADLCQGTSTDGRIDPALARALRGAVDAMRGAPELRRLLDDGVYALAHRDSRRVAMHAPDAAALDEAVGAIGGTIESRDGAAAIVRLAEPADTWRIAPTGRGVRVWPFAARPAPRELRRRFTLDWVREDGQIHVVIHYERADDRALDRARFVGSGVVHRTSPVARRLASVVLAIDANRIAKRPEERVAAAEVDLALGPDELAGYTPVPMPALTAPYREGGPDRVVALQVSRDALTFYFRDRRAKEQSTVVRPRRGR